MSLTVTSDAHQICELLDRLLRADPVRSTVLGSIREIVAGEAGAAGEVSAGWCASRDGSDPPVVAVRSGPTTPIALTVGWTDVAELAELVRTVPDVAGISGPVEAVGPVGARLERLGMPVAHRMAQRLFRLDEFVPPLGAPGAARPAGDPDHALLARWYADFGREAGTFPGAHGTEHAAAAILRSGRAWLWVDDEQPVALASRRAVVGGTSRIGPVYTPPEYRGRGYGSAVTAAATRDILDLGAVPILFTDLANPVSNAIYQRMGYRPVGDYAIVRFG